MLDTTRNVLLILTALGALMSFYIKTISDIFIEVVKSRYKNVPGKQSVFEIAIHWIIYVFVVIYLFIFTSYFIDFIGKGEWITFKNNLSIGPMSAWYSIGLVIVVACVIAIMSPFVIFSNLKQMFIEKLEKDSKRKISNKFRVIIKCGISTSVIISGLGLLYTGSLFIKGINIVKNNGVYIFENNISNSDMNLGISITFITILCGTSFIVLNSLREVYNVINENNIYLLYTDKETIVCRCYLEYNEYYLIFENGMERYIKKSNVKEVRKKRI